MNINVIGAGAIAAWYFLMGRKRVRREARDERALQFMQTAEGSSGTSLQPTIPNAASSRPSASSPVTVQIRALEVAASAPPAMPPALVLPFQAAPAQPAPRVLPVAPDKTILRPVPPAPSSFKRPSFQQRKLLAAENADGTRPPILPRYL